LKWEKSGFYFLSVTANNENGCSNTKTFHIMVGDDHIPVANNDYATTNWLKNIRISLLKNDYDAKNDLDSSSLKILSKPELGDILVERSGAILYTPTSENGGTERLFYSICDSCQQCDTAMVSIHVVEPHLFFPEGISPNGDGMNDQFVIKGLEVFPHSSIAIFRRDGVIMYSNDDYQNDWDGTQNKGIYHTKTVPSGTYYYLLQLGGTRRVIKGYLYLAE
jgi:gliding motility-associated-like protein